MAFQKDDADIQLDQDREEKAKTGQKLLSFTNSKLGMILLSFGSYSRVLT